MPAEIAVDIGDNLVGLVLQSRDPATDSAWPGATRVWSQPARPQPGAASKRPCVVLYGPIIWHTHPAAKACSEAKGGCKLLTNAEFEYGGTFKCQASRFR
ncbi:MAG: hypothetical protein EOO27_43860 [Comamonadaceae bacterium]|nr:MAG: hypothetical protein EOO27_43860 [Comamonadaceae bacterium]